MRPTSLDLMPDPFDWITLPSGSVTLVDYDNPTYFGKKGEQKTFDVPAFSIARYPLTNAQFAVFIQADGYTRPQWWTEEGWQARQTAGWVEPRFWKDDQWNQPDHPVVGVSWHEAIAFCLWLSDITGETITLPTEQHWQRAAQGNTGLLYPWGDRFDEERCNFNTRRTTPVTRYEGRGDSPFGVVDMCCNVWELCLTDYDTGTLNINSNTGSCVSRGGSWRSFDEDHVRTNDRGRTFPGDRDSHVGLRLARV